MAADKYTGEDLDNIKTGLDKVEFVRSQNYLAKLAIMIQKQEKEIARLKAHEYSVQQLELENA